ncbi:diacylglycerol/lipid kinase family protein [Venatoribacter cucullus]|uniref:diacylglycerol/lipid kinase family protein n=1 Tax=Venatoribacter cucullus TaxID=2661630 RepID=UPI00223F0D56|nr:YegS/Rv2252/BmrU family lipid kinase [Venatoribacter cucullus]
MQVLIIFNPTAGTASQQLIDAIEQRLQQAGVTVQRYATRHAGDAMDYLAAYDGELDVVAAAGGDGTLNEVVNGMRQRDNQSWRLAIIPTGTTNVLATELGIRRRAGALAQMILNGREQALYPGRINGRRFLLMAGVGYDAWVVDKVDLALKKKAGKLAYVKSMLQQLRHFGRKQYRLQVDGVPYSASSVVMTNGRCYGGSFIISRQADLRAPTTQVLMMNGGSPWALLLSLLGLPLGLMEKMPGIVSVPARRVDIELVGEQAEPEPVQADGDSLAQLPLQLVMEEQPLRVLVP